MLRYIYMKTKIINCPIRKTTDKRFSTNREKLYELSGLKQVQKGQNELYQKVVSHKLFKQIETGISNYYSKQKNGKALLARNHDIARYMTYFMYDKNSVKQNKKYFAEVLNYACSALLYGIPEEDRKDIVDLNAIEKSLNKIYDIKSHVMDSIKHIENNYKKILLFEESSKTAKNIFLMKSSDLGLSFFIIAETLANFKNCYSLFSNKQQQELLKQSIIMGDIAIELGYEGIKASFDDDLLLKASVDVDLISISGNVNNIIGEDLVFKPADEVNIKSMYNRIEKLLEDELLEKNAIQMDISPILSRIHKVIDQYVRLIPADKVDINLVFREIETAIEEEVSKKYSSQMQIDPILAEIKNRYGKEYNSLKKILENKISVIESLLSKNGISANVRGRVKSLCSLYRKSNERDFDDINDIIAIRILANDDNELEAAKAIISQIGTIHDKKQYPVEKVKDNHRTSDVYRSIHYKIIDNNGIKFELQLRTVAQHVSAETKASHLLYKFDIEDGEYFKEPLFIPRTSRDKKERKLALVDRYRHMVAKARGIGLSTEVKSRNIISRITPDR